MSTRDVVLGLVASLVVVAAALGLLLVLERADGDDVGLPVRDGASGGGLAPGPPAAARRTE